MLKFWGVIDYFIKRQDDSEKRFKQALDLRWLAGCKSNSSRSENVNVAEIPLGLPDTPQISHGLKYAIWLAEWLEYMVILTLMHP